MPQEVTNILIQLPVVALFLWYFERIAKQFQDFLREERAAREKSFEHLSTKIDALDDRVASKIDALDDRVASHDERLEKAVITMTERTAARNVPTKPRKQASA